ncbi:MAG TPA: ribosome recycling factor [Candidatus Polarisedimenticolia bacterium]|nr:ribosome recycling factor [Candidatus Polarisedimenticolia bacterium]
MLKEVLATAEKKMKITVEATRHDLASIRTGRASLAILDGITVDDYGTATPLNQVATLAVPDPTLITVQPWDIGLLHEIEKAILKSDLGLNPANDGRVVRIPIPPLTEERRKQLARKVHQVGEAGKTIIRQHRRDANDHLKALLKDKKVSEDEEKKGLQLAQDLTDRSVQQIDELVQHKEKEILAF